MLYQCWNPWFPADGAIMEGGRICRRQKLSGGSGLRKQAFGFYREAPRPVPRWDRTDDVM